MRIVIAVATLVHIFTALGVVCTLFATLAVFHHQWEQVFIWLGVALIIDGADGPLARKLDVKVVLPRFSGDRLDLVIDYLTYVFVPVLAMIEAGFLQGVIGYGLGIAILLSSLFHFSDTASKTDDHCFVGFPAIWNVVAFYIFVFAPALPVVVGLVLLCVGLTFVPLKWVHPVRVTAWRPLTAAVSVIWAGAAVWATVGGFPAGFWPKAALGFAGVYAIALCVWHGNAQAMPSNRR